MERDNEAFFTSVYHLATQERKRFTATVKHVPCSCLNGMPSAAITSVLPLCTCSLIRPRSTVQALKAITKPNCLVEGLHASPELNTEQIN